MSTGSSDPATARHTCSGAGSPEDVATVASSAPEQAASASVVSAAQA
ncbi:hypothetical protein ACTXK0_02730 [Corynebacterium variabile]|nr:hypothetical protein [Corynebacterium variabile]MDN6242304.1 hypothetical protein [Corynebacterium variabile]MDN6478322.1 hypothetical protein [Corynebacterium variabile]MDN6678024.1 hypothetical protein [Corynebacterium variabile]MDN6845006.1 hypothetical protein [Corynebacterium variabile]